MLWQVALCDDVAILPAREVMHPCQVDFVTTLDTVLLQQFDLTS